MDAATRAHIERAHARLAHYITKLANEPSVGLYYVQNHIYTSLPKLVETKREIQRKTAQVEGLIQDTEYSQHTVKVIAASPSFEQTRRHMQSSITSLEQIIKASAPAARSPPVQGSIPVISPVTVGATAAAVVSLATVAHTNAPFAAPRPASPVVIDLSPVPASPSVVGAPAQLTEAGSHSATPTISSQPVSPPQSDK